MNKHKLNGFTIVELLIVIVVIGILAAITVVAYNGIQQRANNSQNGTAVRTLRQALVSYATVNKAYPLSNSVCLGEGYQDLDSNGSLDCGTTGVNANFSKSTTMDNALSEYGGKVTVSPKRYVYGSWTQMGATFEYVPTYTLNGASQPWWITYVVGGSTEKCSSYIGGIDMTGNPNYSSTPQSGWNGASETWPNAIKCWVPLPNPATL